MTRHHGLFVKVCVSTNILLLIAFYVQIFGKTTKRLRVQLLPGPRRICILLTNVLYTTWWTTRCRYFIPPLFILVPVCVHATSMLFLQSLSLTPVFWSVQDVDMVNIYLFKPFAFWSPLKIIMWKITSSLPQFNQAEQATMLCGSVYAELQENTVNTTSCSSCVVWCTVKHNAAQWRRWINWHPG